MGWVRRRRASRRQLEQHVERWLVHGESEQCAIEHEQQHRVSVRFPFGRGARLEKSLCPCSDAHRNAARQWPALKSQGTGSSYPGLTRMLVYAVVRGSEICFFGTTAHWVQERFYNLRLLCATHRTDVPFPTFAVSVSHAFPKISNNLRQCTNIPHKIRRAAKTCG
jgi:hypothetical protein